MALRPQSILSAMGGAQGLIVKEQTALREFDEVFAPLSEVAGVLEEAGISSSMVRVRSFRLCVCAGAASRVPLVVGVVSARAFTLVGAYAHTLKAHSETFPSKQLTILF